MYLHKILIRFYVFFHFYTYFNVFENHVGWACLYENFVKGYMGYRNQVNINTVCIFDYLLQPDPIISQI